ncbi:MULTISPECIES: metal-dependent hydrolase [Halorussus]|uniref:metal-dependent hydrolase n=1 Tax=Halorussus TaxID=1070314 RepID=UPI00209E4F90|nr:metal-dependent hydrolase [Halorussus vallis]USZ76362.1 metal-dependent hydrolase [Halorussus vallis]
MVDVLGHLGMALIWLAPAWYFLDRPKTAATFVGLSFWFGMLPDVDLYLSNWFAGIHHHGVVHTILAVAIFAVVLGPMLGWVFKKIGESSDWFSERATDSAYSIGVIAILVAGLSHLFADMLSAPDVAQPIEPFWPLYNGQIVLMDVVWYKSFWATWGLFLAGLAINAGLWYWKDANTDSRTSTPSA